MDLFIISLIYLLSFRIAIIAAGIVSMVLGYKLFTKDVTAVTGNNPATDINAQIGTIKFKLKQVAPGTCFALFGIILITAMVLQSSPEVIYRHMRQAGNVADSVQATATNTTTEVILKGSGKPSETASMDTAIAQLSAGDTTAAIASFRENAAAAAPAMNTLAWLYLQKGKSEEALPLSIAAVNLKPDNADYHHTLAKICQEKNDTLSYKQHLSAAARLNKAKYGSEK